VKNCCEQVKGFEKEEVRLSEDDRADIYGKAKTNRGRLRNGLEKNEDPKPIGFHTQGSYSMRTMIQDSTGDYDVDDGVYFKRVDLQDANGVDKKAVDAREMVCKALQDERFNKAPETKKNCVRVYYNEGYHVDVPVYREIQTKDDSTGAMVKSYQLASSDWKASDPQQVTKWFKSRNEKLCTDFTANGNNGQFVRAVRLMKAFARSRNNWRDNVPSGIAISRLVSDHFKEYVDRDDVAFRELMKALRDRADESVDHPILNEKIESADNGKVAYLKARLKENIPHLDILDKADCSHEDAMTAWDKVFNTDWFSRQPDPEDEEDLDKKTSGPAVVKGGERRYA